MGRSLYFQKCRQGDGGHAAAPEGEVGVCVGAARGNLASMEGATVVAAAVPAVPAVVVGAAATVAVLALAAL